MQQLIANFLTHLEAEGRAPRTITEYAKRLKILEGSNEITPAVLDQLIAGKRRAGLATATVASYIQAIKTLCKWGLERGYLKENPARGLSRPRLRQCAESKAMLQSDLEAMLNLAEQQELEPERTILLVIADTGCRAGELCALNLADLDLEHHEAVSRGKTGPRRLDYTDATEAALRKWLRIRPATDPAALFTTREGRISYGYLYHLLMQIGKAVQAKRYNPHAIRHRVGQGWIDAGANLELVRQKLGHEDINTTAKFYGNQDRPRIKAASRKYSLVKGRE